MASNNPWILRSMVLMCVVLFAAFSFGEETLSPKKLAPGESRNLFDGKSLTGWQIAKKFDFEKHGKIEIVRDEIQLKKGMPSTGLFCTQEIPRQDYEITFEAKRIDGSDFFCGLTFPIENAYCTLILGGWGGNVTGLSNINEEPAVENESAGSVSFQQNRWYSIRLKVAREQIEAWVDKERIIAVATKDKRFAIWWEQEPMRPLGIATWQTSAAFRNLRLKKL